jgi:hypothetical protein
MRHERQGNRRANERLSAQESCLFRNKFKRQPASSAPDSLRVTFVPPAAVGKSGFGEQPGSMPSAGKRGNVRANWLSGVAGGGIDEARKAPKGLSLSSPTRRQHVSGERPRARTSPVPERVA